MMDCVAPAEPISCTRKQEECLNSGNNDRLVELLSLFHNTASVKGKSRSTVNALRDEIKEVLERKVKSDHEKTADKALNNVAQLRESMDFTIDSQTNESESSDDSRIICDGNVRVLIAEQVVDLEGKLEYSEKEKGKTKKIQQLEKKNKELEGELKKERSKSSSILKHAKESEKKYKELQSRLEHERKTTERCQGIAKTLNCKLLKIRSLLEEAANKQNPSWQTKLQEVKLHLDEAALQQLEILEHPSKIPRKKQ